MRTIRRAWRRARETAALVATLTDYWTTVFPAVRREMAGWRAHASEIPDPDIRELALRTFDGEAGLAEGAAIFATLVPARAMRRQLVQLLVAWQVAYDYLDTIGERLADDASSASADVYEILSLALRPAADYRGHADDGGYLDRLVGCCRASVGALPSFGAVGPVAVRAAERCAEGQTHTHAVASVGREPLCRWAREQPGSEGYLWWEVAAGAISSLAVHATLATAALPHATAADATRVDAAYFPSICALSTLLDSTIDAADDAGTSNHRSTAYYGDPERAAARIEAITRTAAAAARALPRGPRHVVILAGMATYYAAAGWTAHERLHRRVASALELGTGPILWTLRLRAVLRRGAPPSPQARGERCGDGGHPAANAPARRWGVRLKTAPRREASSGAFAVLRPLCAWLCAPRGAGPRTAVSQHEPEAGEGERSSQRDLE